MFLTGAALSAGGSLLGLGDDSGEEAAAARAEAARKAAAEYDKYATQARGEITAGEEKGVGTYQGAHKEGLSYTQPYRDAGANSLDAYVASLGLGGKDAQQQVINQFQASPGYQFAMDQGVKARDASAAAKGQLMSGGLLKELTTYGQGVANQEYGGWQQKLSDLANFGGQVSQNAATQSMQTGQNIGGLQERSAGNRASSLTGQATNASDAALAEGEAQAGGIEAQGKQRQGIAGTLGSLGGSMIKKSGFLG